MNNSSQVSREFCELWLRALAGKRPLPTTQEIDAMVDRDQDISVTAGEHDED